MESSYRQAFRARKDVILKPEEMAIWEDRKDCEKRKIYYSKFRLDNKAGKALMATRKVKIVNKGPRLKTIVCEKLMETRDHLNYMKQRSVTKLR